MYIVYLYLYRDPAYRDLLKKLVKGDTTVDDVIGHAEDLAKSGHI